MKNVQAMMTITNLIALEIAKHIIIKKVLISSIFHMRKTTVLYEVN